MLGQHLPVVHPVDVVAGEDQHPFGLVRLHEVQVLPEGVGGAVVPVGGAVAGAGRQDAYAPAQAVQIPGLAHAQVAHERDVHTSLYLEIKAAFDQAGIEIPFPHLSLYTGSVTEPMPVQLVDAEKASAASS